MSVSGSLGVMHDNVWRLRACTGAVGKPVMTKGGYTAFAGRARCPENVTKGLVLSSLWHRLMPEDVELRRRCFFVDEPTAPRAAWSGGVWCETTLLLSLGNTLLLQCRDGRGIT